MKEIKAQTLRRPSHEKAFLGSQVSYVFLILLICMGIGCSDDGDSGQSVDDMGSNSDSNSSSDMRSDPDARGVEDMGSDAGLGNDMGMIEMPQSCALRGEAIVAATGNTITVSPAGNAMVTVDGATRTLRQVVSDAASGDTILLEDGTYTLPEASEGSYSGLYFQTPDVTMRSKSGDPTRVIIDSAYVNHGGGSASITVAASGVTLADFTVQRSIFHLIHFWAEGDSAVVHNVHLVDGGQQFMKASPGNDAYVDGADIGCSQFRMTAVGRDNVWGYGASDGGTKCYTGGIDTHDSRNWSIHDNYFEGIYCNADGVSRPAHGKSPDERGGQTYTGGLSEHAIHMWDSEAGSGHVIERNRIVNCARGIGLGLRDEVYGTMIRNNSIFSEHAGSGEHDVGIVVERAHDTQVFNNTVFYSSSSAYSNAIEYRWASTSGLEVRNNLTNQQVRSRNDADAATSNNVTDAEAAWFANAGAGDLHLATCDEPSVVGMGDVLGAVSVDIDGESRGTSNDIGADDCSSD